MWSKRRAVRPVMLEFMNYYMIYYFNIITIIFITIIIEILENRSTKVSPAVSSTSALVPLGLGVRMVT